MDFIWILFILLIGFVLLKTINVSDKDKSILKTLWIFHFLISIYYALFSRLGGVTGKGGGGDAWGYWKSAQQMSTDDFINNLFSTQGTEFMNAFNYIPANIFGMSFFANTLFFGLLGFIGFIFIYHICIQTIPYNSNFFKYPLFPLLLFLPNLHFWSSGIGKDTMLFLCIAMIAYGVMNIAKRFPLIVIALLLSYGIRPHITLIITVSFGFAYILNGKVSKSQRIALSVLLATIAVAILPAVLEYTKIEDASLDSLESFSENQAAGLSNGLSFVDISSYPYPLKVLTFLYRPFFFDINGIPALIASFENLLLLLLSIQVMRKHPVRAFKAAPLAIQGLFIFFILGILVFSMSMSNLGIILRMRNMFLPGLILFILWTFSYQQEWALRKMKET
jgi:hypothetical protein